MPAAMARRWRSPPESDRGVALGAGGQAEGGKQLVGLSVGQPQLGAGAVGEQLVAGLLHDEVHRARSLTGGENAPIERHRAGSLPREPRQAARTYSKDIFNLI